jgi:hypothetical protein
MFTGAHLLLYSPDAEADRGFFRVVLGFASVDAGGGWLIFALRASAPIEQAEWGVYQPTHPTALERA